MHQGTSRGPSAAARGGLSASAPGKGTPATVMTMSMPAASLSMSSMELDASPVAPAPAKPAPRPGDAVPRPAGEPLQPLVVERTGSVRLPPSARQRHHVPLRRLDRMWLHRRLPRRRSRRRRHVAMWLPCLRRRARPTEPTSPCQPRRPLPGRRASHCRPSVARRASHPLRRARTNTLTRPTSCPATTYWPRTNT